MNIDYVETAKWALPIIFGSGGLFAYLAAGKQRKSSTSQITTSQAALVDAVNEQTITILAENKRLRSESNRAQRALKRRVDTLAREVASCNERHEDCERGQAELRAHIDKLMAEAPAGPYTEIKRVAD